MKSYYAEQQQQQQQEKIMKSHFKTMKFHFKTMKSHFKTMKSEESDDTINMGNQKVVLRALAFPCSELKI